jgi:predicted ABC-type exoprotein transport system permease subunit
MTEQEKLIHNARVELNVAFLSRLGFMCILVGIMVPLFVPALFPSWIVLILALIIFGIGLNVAAFMHISHLR